MKNLSIAVSLFIVTGIMITGTALTGSIPGNGPAAMVPGLNSAPDQADPARTWQTSVDKTRLNSDADQAGRLSAARKPATAVTGDVQNPDVPGGRAAPEAHPFEPYSQEIPGTGEEIEMVPVAGGTFTMGSPENEEGRSEAEGPRRRVAVDSLWVGKFEITWAQYDRFVEEMPGNLAAGNLSVHGDVELDADAISLPTPPYIDMSFGMGRDGYPAINMTHYAAVMFTRWLTAKTGHFYRLPTEAEWEYSCRGGTETAAWFGDNLENAGDFEWHAGNSDGSYNRIGTKEPNPFGMYDMLGNVAEWTMDEYREDYFEQLEGEIADNPWFRPEVLYPRSVRGGSWRDGPEAMRCANRRGSEERWKRMDPQIPKSLWWHTSVPFVGFRIVRPKETPSEEELEQYWIDAMEDF